MPGKGNPFVQARLPKELYDALHAKARGNDLSQMVRQAIVEYTATASCTVPLRTPRKPTRTQRLGRLCQDARDLLDEYSDWQSTLPENLTESSTAERLTETIGQLSEVVDLLDAIEPPRGFGRD